MNKIIVATYFDGTQGLLSISQVLNIGRQEAIKYKQQWRREKIRLEALSDFCIARKIRNLEVFFMDGRKDGWIIKQC